MGDGVRAKGQITVFTSLIMMCIFSLLCGLLESVRTAGARHYLQTAMSSSLDSVFSQYHLQMWDSYRLLFAEYEDESQLREDFEQFLLPYLETDNWYPIKLESTVTEEWLTATDHQGVHLEQEILEYMKYGIWKLDFDETTVEGVWDTIREAGAVKAVATDYQKHAKDALKLERAIEAISESQRKQLQGKQEGLSELRAYRGGAFRRTANQLIRELKRIPALVAGYQKQADALSGGLAASRAEFSLLGEEIGVSAREALEQEIHSYEAYIDQDGTRRQEIQQLSSQSQQQIRLIEAVIEQANEVEQIIADWESDEEEDGPDLEALWSPVIRQFTQFTVNSLSFSHGVKDKEREGWLNQVLQMGERGALVLVLPEGTELSQGRLDRVELPSETGTWATGSRSVLLPKRLLINEYCGQFFPDFLSPQVEADSAHATLVYEMEYLLAGGKTDEGNLSNVVARLLAVREGLNLIHILADGEKREAARNLALMITGAAGLTPLVTLTTFFIMSVWALGESIADIRGLLAAKRISLLKSKLEWTLNMENLLSMGKQGELVTGGGETGLDYSGWIKVLLLMEDIVKQEYRIMDMIQMNLRKEQDNFRMRRGVYQVKLKSSLSGKRVFFSLGFMENVAGQGPHTYSMVATVERVY